MRGRDAWIRARDAWEGAGMWEGAVKGGGDPSLGLETHESGLGTHGLQGEGMDVARDACVMEGDRCHGCHSGNRRWGTSPL